MHKGRPIYEIADEIRYTWLTKTGDPNVNYAAEPYLNAMQDITEIDEMYGADTARSVVAYFLSNASSFRGEDARRLKAELKTILENG